MSRDTACMLQDTSCMSQDTSCLLLNTFDVTHVAARKREREVEWLGTKREMPFQLSSQ